MVWLKDKSHVCFAGGTKKLKSIHIYRKDQASKEADIKSKFPRIGNEKTKTTHRHCKIVFVVLMAGQIF